MLIRGNTEPNMYLSMFDISDSLRYGELNVFYVSEIGPEIRTGCTWDRFDGALCVVRRSNCKKLTTLLMYERAHRGTPSHGFILLRT